MTIERFPVFREDLRLTTWASARVAGGPSGAHRFVGERGRLDRGGGTVGPRRHRHRSPEATRAPDFFDVYGEAAGGRTVHARLSQGGPPDGGQPTPWPLRFSDFDVLGHVNNAVYWAIVEECFDVPAHSTVTVEYRGGVDRGQLRGSSWSTATSCGCWPTGRWRRRGGSTSRRYSLSPVRRGLWPTPFV